MRKSILMGIMTTTLAMSLFTVAATTTGPFNILLANADPDGKSKTYESEDGIFDSQCQKDVNCKGFKVNKFARDICEQFSDPDSKCKRAHN